MRGNLVDDLFKWGRVHEFAKAVTARAAFGRLIRMQDVSSADKLLQAATQHYEKILGEDSTWRIDNGVLQHLCGPGAEDRVISQLKEALPSKDNPDVTISHCLGTLEAMVASEMFRLTPRSSQSQLTLCVGWLRTLSQSGHTSNKIQGKSAMLKLVQQSAEFFFKHDHKGKTHIGAPAMELLVTEMKTKDKTKKLDEASITILRQFQWLASEADFPAVNILLKNWDYNAAKAATSTKRLSTKSSSSDSKKARSDSAAKAAMDMFS